LIVCIRFSAWAKTIDAGDSKTSSVTSSPSIPVFSNSSAPTLVSRLWNAGRTHESYVGLPVFWTRSALIW
jgi:hypothetical protein